MNKKVWDHEQEIWDHEQESMGSWTGEYGIMNKKNKKYKIQNEKKWLLYSICNVPTRKLNYFGKNYLVHADIDSGNQLLFWSRKYLVILWGCFYVNISHHELIFLNFWLLLPCLIILVESKKINVANWLSRTKCKIKYRSNY